jgi:hypothetical protein
MAGGRCSCNVNRCGRPSVAVEASTTATTTTAAIAAGATEGVGGGRHLVLLLLSTRGDEGGGEVADDLSAQHKRLKKVISNIVGGREWLGPIQEGLQVIVPLV